MGKKAIFVDGQSLFHMTIALGIGSTKYNQLWNLLVKEIGDCRELFNRPFYTITHAGFLKMKKPITYAGFDLFATRTGNGKDDQEIITRINKLPEGSDEVSEIVLVAADGDYIPVLQKQAGQGKKIFVLATEALNREGRSMTSSQLKEEFNFVALDNFKAKIMRHEWRPYFDEEGGDADLEKSNRPRQLTNLEVVLTLTDGAGMVGNFFADLSDIVAKYPKMKMHTNTEPLNQ